MKLGDECGFYYALRKKTRGPVVFAKISLILRGYGASTALNIAGPIASNVSGLTARE